MDTVACGLIEATELAEAEAAAPGQYNKWTVGKKKYSPGLAAWSKWPSWRGHIWPPWADQAAPEGSRLSSALAGRGAAPQIRREAVALQPEAVEVETSAAFDNAGLVGQLWLDGALQFAAKSGLRQVMMPLQRLLATCSHPIPPVAEPDAPAPSLLDDATASPSQA